MSLLKDPKSSFKLHLIGGGEKESELRQLSRDLKIENKVIFHGGKSQEWISRFLPNMKLAIAPLSGRALLEIALSGLPVVAYEVDWHNEIVIQNETGFLVEYRNIELLSHEIEKFFALPESQRLKMGEKMRIKALSLCDRDTLRKSQNYFYQQLIG
jgi:glycosyltransferase involved in cell wall biosynthesis